ncbi:37S ribosomal protein S22 [Coemansia spiralis]|uniref:37S ribosomal protein S22 n=1 Tax=Coemansia spiralis TaxID=417178 RepID=A0A9W8G8U5_9FUNG|nr:mitochondrial small ribosomal subunit Rsm22-domain-containing protein [Coemansia spiralis]KAJ2622541.1 37S ribosomal protein S22 [Coemansia sp. RSA 1358]KAJ2677091.1 37S ribosomal protein S22 [Coemansia spiralis]
MLQLQAKLLRNAPQLVYTYANTNLIAFASTRKLNGLLELRQRKFSTCTISRNKQVPDVMWIKPPISPSEIKPLERLETLPQETETDKKVRESLLSLDEDVRYMYEENIRNSGPLLRGTDEVRFGRKYIGMVTIPVYIRDAIEVFIKNANKKTLRYDYLRIADSLRSTGEVTPRGKGKGRAAKEQRVEDRVGKKLEIEDDNAMPKPLPGERIELVVPGKRPSPESLVNPGMRLKPHTLEFGGNETAAYVAGYAPATYGAIYNVLFELAYRIPGFRPESILDFGAGPAPTLWAAQEVWPQFNRYLGVDISEDMLLCAEAMLDSAPDNVRAQDIEFARYLAPEPTNQEQQEQEEQHTQQRKKDYRFDLVISAFTLSDLPSDAVRKTTVETLWNRTKDTLILIDRGTPDSARMISEARDQLLELAKTATEGSQENGNTTSSGIHTLAPFTNDLPDPTIDTPSWIHFSQRIQRPTYSMHLKRSKSNVEDIRYSYIIMRRGSRPVLLPEDLKEPEQVSSEIAQENPDEYLPSGVRRKSKEQLSRESHYWPRIILPPIKRKGHVIADVCTVDGKVERWTFTKSHDKQAYRDARKSSWGDLFPHTPKSSVIRPQYEPFSKPEAEDKRPRRVRRSDFINDDE